MPNNFFVRAAIFLLLLTSFACGSNDYVPKNVTQYNFLEIKKSYPDTLVSHFPEDLFLMTGYIHESGEDAGNIRLQLNLKLDREAIDTLNDALNRTSIAKYQADDSCLLIVNRFLRLTNWGFKNTFQSARSRPANCSGYYLPVPNFWQDIDTKNKRMSSRLPKDYTIYVLEANASKITDSADKNIGRYLPEEWKEGYSKGVAINRSNGSALYWFIAW